MQLCDRQADCRDGSDEKKCNYSTTAAPSTSSWLRLGTTPSTPLGRLTTAPSTSQVRLATAGVPTAQIHVVASSFFKECSGSQFACKSGTCIDRVRLCDKHWDCPGGDDEAEFCSLCNGHGCQHECERTPMGPICVCSAGYKLAADGRSCVDIDECEVKSFKDHVLLVSRVKDKKKFIPSEGQNKCDQGCENVLGSFLCSCAPGYELEADARTCKLVQQSGQIMFSVGHEIRNMPLFSYPGHEDNYAVMMEAPAGRLTGLDYNSATSHYFFTEHDSGEVYKADPVPKCLISGLFAPQAVAVDWV